ncbi:CopG family transcriptional regulator [Dickeya oryzae]|uniref:CopG family transcriptional regulator n=1 Tax=Dickeya oryzae TaxID=1240404 RepID=UPI001AECB1EC|nr:CopG family transcriptional regulator [Dickeya oryzae]MBP2846532.1 CopG family transcriptional regulator [Dickeya oryzae]
MSLRIFDSLESYDKKTKKTTVALTSLIEAEQRHQRILQGLADVDVGRAVNHADMQAFIARLKQA